MGANRFARVVVIGVVTVSAIAVARPASAIVFWELDCGKKEPVAIGSTATMHFRARSTDPNVTSLNVVPVAKPAFVTVGGTPLDAGSEWIFAVTATAAPTTENATAGQVYNLQLRATDSNGDTALCQAFFDVVAASGTTKPTNLIDWIACVIVEGFFEEHPDPDAVCGAFSWTLLLGEVFGSQSESTTWQPSPVLQAAARAAFAG